MQKKKIKGKGKKKSPSTSANERSPSSIKCEELRKDYVRESIDDANDPPLGNCVSTIGDLLGCPGYNRWRRGGKEEKKSGLQAAELFSRTRKISPRFGFCALHCKKLPGKLVRM